VYRKAGTRQEKLGGAPSYGDMTQSSVLHLSQKSVISLPDSLFLHILISVDPLIWGFLKILFAVKKYKM
jgi:hypothetical protein